MAQQSVRRGRKNQGFPPCFTSTLRVMWFRSANSHTGSQHSSTAASEAGQMAASDQRARHSRNYLRRRGRPQMESGPRSERLCPDRHLQSPRDRQTVMVASLLRERLVSNASTIATASRVGTSPVRCPLIIGSRIDSHAMIKACTTLDQTTNQMSEVLASGLFAARIMKTPSVA